jgi:LytS/YehU family sensor histidine kinase
LFYKMVLIRTLFQFICQMAFCYPLLYVLMPRFFWKKKYLLFGFLFLLLSIAVAVFRYVVFTYGYNPLMQQLGYIKMYKPIMPLFSFRQTFSGMAYISVVFIAGKIFKDWQQRQADNFNLKKEAANAELQLLKAQIHPHFLFNTLNNIYAFTLSKSPQAKSIVKKLEDMLHYMIEECEQSFVPVRNELKVLQDYFDLERIRYGNSLEMELQITGDFANTQITPLLMIPFVENSFKHGTSKMLRAPWIKLFIQKDENRLHFTLANSKPPEESTSARSGIGLHNVKKRLELLYPESHLLVIESTTNTFTVNLQIPLMSETKPDKPAF